MKGESWLLVTDASVKFENLSVEVQEFKKIIDNYRGIYWVYLKLIMKNRKIIPCNRLDLETPGSQQIMLKNLLDIGTLS